MLFIRNLLQEERKVMIKITYETLRQIAALQNKTISRGII